MKIPFTKTNAFEIKKFSIDAKILFHKDANGVAHHGLLCAEHKALNISKSDGVRFAFDGIDPPEMTAEVMAYIQDQAERQGYIVHSLHSYATVLTVQPAPPRLHQDRHRGAPRGTATRGLRRPEDAQPAAESVAA